VALPPRSTWTAFDLTGGQKGDAPHFPILLGLGPDIEPRAAVGDKAMPARPTGRRHESIPVIPHKANGKQRPGFFAKALYKGRAPHRTSRRQAQTLQTRRCEKTKRNFASIVALTAGFILVKSVHTA
jgi:hypothetical protein